MSTHGIRFHWFHYASPKTFDALARRLTPLFAIAALVLAACGLYIGLMVAPTDAVQGDVYRIMFIHVPAAWMSMLHLRRDGGLRGARPDLQRALVRDDGARARADRRALHVIALVDAARCGAARPGAHGGSGMRGSRRS